MNNTNKILNVNSSSLVDLKAELIRKQQEFRKEKATGGSKSALLAAKRAAHKKVSVFSKKNVGVQERALRDLEEKGEEDRELDRSRGILEAKAKLYEKMTTGGRGLDLPDDEDGGRFLVDFQKKAVDDALQKRLELRKREEEEELIERKKLLEEKRQTDERRKKEADEEKRELLLDVPAPNDPSEEWVDYTDSLGRSRRCLRKDLPELIKQDKSLMADNTEFVDSSKLNMNERDLMSEDMYREMLREKWEAEQRELLDKQETVHYANVRFDEKRTHGVGFYDFARDEESRQEQLKALDELRNQTIVARERKEKLKEKRKVMTAARLAKVRQRKMINNSNTEAEEAADSEDEDFIGPSLSEAAKKQEPELLTRDETLRKDAPVREWDKGKKDTSTWFDQPHRTPEKSYIDLRRDERESEFAPPQAYFEQAVGKQLNKNKFPLKREKIDIFKKLDPMAALDEGQREKRAEFGPPSDYFSVPVKKTKLNSLGASVEDEVLTASSVNDMISSGLSSIRADVEKKTHPITSNCADIRNIPLPPETVVELPQQNDIANYQEHEMQFYPRQFVVEPENVPYSTKQSFGQHSASDVTGMSLSTASEIQYSSNQGQSGASYNDKQTPAKPVDKKCSTQENTSLKQAPPVGIISAAPMMYDRAGSRVGAPVKPRYERVHLHQVPLTLPAPPSAGHMPHYPSQEDVHQTKRDNQEKDSVKHWYKQYSDNKVKPSTANIPFPSPYVQSESSEKDMFETTGFDPSKPPPNMSKSK